MRIVICESAANHPDGTYTIHRGGMDRWSKAPVRIAATMFIEGTTDELPQGVLNITGMITEPSGVKYPVMGMASPSVTADVVRFVCPFEVDVYADGVVLFHITIGTATAVASIRVGS